MIKTKVAFLEGRLISSQSKQFEKFSKSSDWLEKAGPPKSQFCFDHINRLIVTLEVYLGQIILSPASIHLQAVEI